MHKVRATDRHPLPRQARDLVERRLRHGARVDARGRGLLRPPGERVPTATDCYRFVLSNPAVNVCMTGPANEGQAAEALRALEMGPMNEEELEWMRRVGDFIHK